MQLCCLQLEASCLQLSYFACCCFWELLCLRLWFGVILLMVGALLLSIEGSVAQHVKLECMYIGKDLLGTCADCKSNNQLKAKNAVSNKKIPPKQGDARGVREIRCSTSSIRFHCKVPWDVQTHRSWTVPRTWHMLWSCTYHELWQYTWCETPLEQTPCSALHVHVFPHFNLYTPPPGPHLGVLDASGPPQAPWTRTDYWPPWAPLWLPPFSLCSMISHTLGKGRLPSIFNITRCNFLCLQLEASCLQVEFFVCELCLREFFYSSNPHVSNIIGCKFPWPFS